jgi:hypothetical protein
MKVGRRLKIAAGAVVVTITGAALSFGPLVRAKVSSTAERYGASVTVESVSPRWNGATLRGVVVKLEDAPSVAITLDEVVVDGALGSSRSVVARGGEARATGGPDQMAAELAALRERLAKKGSSAGGDGPKTSLRLEGMRAHWERASGTSEKLDAEGVSVAPVDGGLDVTVDSFAGTVGRVTASAKGIDLGLERADGGFRARRLTATEAFVDLSSEAPPAMSAADEAPARTAPEGRRGDIARAVAMLREKGELVLGALDARLTPQTALIVEQSTARVRVRGEAVSIGPGRLEVRREDGTPRKLVVEVARAAGAGGGDRLTARLTLPLGEGAPSAPIKLEMHGGPIPIAALGLREGDLGLLEPDRGSLAADATIELDDAAQIVRFDGEGHVKGLALQHAALSDQPLKGIDVGFRGKVEAPLDGSTLRAQKAEIELGALRLVGSGTVNRSRGEAGKPDAFKVDVKFEVPLVACQSVLDAAPAGLFPVVAGSTMAGSLAVTGHAAFDTAQLDKTYDVAWNAAVGCRMVAPRPQAAVERFQKPFKKTIYTPEGSRTEAEFGPGTESWVPHSRITHLMGVAVITAEDGRFERHGGFDHEAIRNSIRENIRARRFVRGASTISMQLAKNLYLPRDKTLSRKLEEALLTLYLEQVLTKDQMMELYLNVVEFGPMVYGIGPAARHYFRTSPEALTVSQCYYLASILPSPKKQHFAAGGAVSGAWMSHLRRLMKYAHHRGRLTDAELDEGMSEVPVFGSSSPVREARDEAPAGEDEGVRREPWADQDGDG